MIKNLSAISKSLLLDSACRIPTNGVYRDKLQIKITGLLSAVQTFLSCKRPGIAQLERLLLPAKKHFSHVKWESEVKEWVINLRLPGDTTSLVTEELIRNSLQELLNEASETRARSSPVYAWSSLRSFWFWFLSFVKCIWRVY